jgi:hypothetical protein
MVQKLAKGLFLIAISLTTQAQSTIKISGKVVDSDNNEPLEYASISLKGRSIGTVTNADGRFDFYISAGLSSDTVMISFLGYNPYLAVADILGVTPNKVIKLKPKPLVLGEVVITDKTPMAAEILARAFNNVGANFPTTPYVYVGFVREVWSENNKTVSLLESAVDIYDDGYRAGKKKSINVREKIDLKFARASENYMKSPFKTAAGKYNTLAGALKWNLVKYQRPDKTNDVKAGEAIIENVVSSNNRTLYVVSFISHSASYELWERKDTYYIDDETFAIKKFMSREYGRKSDYRSPQWPLDSVHSYQAKDAVSVYEFEEYQGKMYLKYFNSAGQYDIFNSRTKSVEYEIEGTTMIVVTDINPVGKKAVVNTMDHKKSLTLQTTTPYNASFWTNYDQVKLVPLTDKQVRDLESKESLTEQFLRSASPRPKGRAGKNR